MGQTQSGAEAAIERELELAVECLRAGGLVGMPTETVYGLAADGLNPEAVARIFRVKGRPLGHPVILHVASLVALEPLCHEVSDLAWRLAGEFWPGPLTMILRRSSLVPDAVTGGLATVGVRMPSHPVARALLERFGGPLAAPSANRFGKVSPTRREHVVADLGQDVPLVLEGGACQVGVESTIVDLSGGTLRILRHGSVTREQLESRLGQTVLEDDGNGPRAPGTLPSHYAPRARVEIVERSDLWSRVCDLSARVRVGVLAQTDVLPTLPTGVQVRLLSLDPTVFARELYLSLRALDEQGCDVIVTHLPELSGVGRAVADRLTRAAAERPCGPE